MKILPLQTEYVTRKISKHLQLIAIFQINSEAHLQKRIGPQRTNFHKIQNLCLSNMGFSNNFRLLGVQINNPIAFQTNEKAVQFFCPTELCNLLGKLEKFVE